MLNKETCKLLGNDIKTPNIIKHINKSLYLTIKHIDATKTKLIPKITKTF